MIFYLLRIQGLFSIRNNLTALDINKVPANKVGSITYRDSNAKAVYPLNEKTNVKQQITSVYERNK